MMCECILLGFGIIGPVLVGTAVLWLLTRDQQR